MTDLNRPRLSKHLWLMYAVSIVLLGFIWYFEWILGIVMTVLLVLSFYYTIRIEKKLTDETERYISTLSYRVKKVGEEALLEMPIGIILYNDDFIVEWSNHYMNQFAEEETIVGESLNVISEELIPMIKENNEEFRIEIDDYAFQTIIRKEERLIYLFDQTEQSELETLYTNEQTVLSIIFLDNYDEITQNMDDTIKSQLNSEVTSFLNHWAHDNGLYLKRTSQDRFLAVGTREILNKLERTKFNILDEMHELNSELDIPITLSIGVGVGNAGLPELGELAQSSLDLALGRGGDQVAIKDDSGKVRFYGGKTNPMEKRTRVRARVISHALRDLVKASDRVIIMGHQAPDMDSIGSAIGILNIAQTNGVDGYIVFDPDDISIGVKRLVEAIKVDSDLWQHFIDPDNAEDLITSRSLIVVVDTHKPSMVVSKRLLGKTDYRVVIDHHRRAEEFIENPTLVYMEPYASSTSELVTELLEYQPKGKKLKMLEATALLAGITVDTKSFTLRTGSRTFDAASYLRAKGADTVLVQQFLKEDLNLYIKRSKMIERCQIYRNSIAITKADPGDVCSPVLIAQTADTLLTMTGISASFVIAERSDGKIGISARSLGEINVQIIMEKMNGGGHLTNAATQIEDTTIDDVELLLKEILDEYYEGREAE
ncbi:DHH family phosphoesterase [Ornithinibacillus bavariensis]|uniref:Cyclic-di-AMP phosphodiesterase n=1 Tax=Ornithinibacillus bavariensis TaxID=545502 RepID=A0A919X904_9BACI|nr:DHH family phosphoesterase [Ornithinibacillus bavariensis]GIO28236.1 cyclic-di-AMP phosphodiesterase GdpP [Ornithinibacillus bavariensis]